MFNKAGEIVSVAQQEFSQIYPKAGWVEHDPLEIWTTQMSVAIAAMGKAGVTAENIAGIGITNPVSYTHLDVYKRQAGRCP